jgi:hypothetical protein
MLDAFASGFLVFATFATALFQLALVLGAPMGEYAFGGQSPKLPAQYRFSSAVSFLVMLAISGHYVAQLGWLAPLLEPDLNAIINWVLVGFFTLSAVVNNLTKSEKEKRLWGGVTIAMLLCSIIVAV